MFVLSAPANPKAALKSKIVAEFTVSINLFSTTIVFITMLCFFSSYSERCTFLPYLQPSTLIDQLSVHKRAIDEEVFREQQLEALRVDVCSTEALKRLKGKGP